MLTILRVKKRLLSLIYGEIFHAALHTFLQTEATQSLALLCKMSTLVIHSGNYCTYFTGLGQIPRRFVARCCLHGWMDGERTGPLGTDMQKAPDP